MCTIYHSNNRESCKRYYENMATTVTFGNGSLIVCGEISSELFILNQKTMIVIASAQAHSIRMQ